MSHKKTAFDRLVFHVAEEVARSLEGVEPEDVAPAIRAALPETQAQAQEEAERIDAMLREQLAPAVPQDSPLKKLRKALHADGLSLRCLIEAATQKVEELAKEKERRVYYQNIVYSVCNALDVIEGSHVVCGTAGSPTTEVQDAMLRLVEEQPWPGAGLRIIDKAFGRP
jgi:hypothetical protein